jgi:hypothetical protein
MAGFGIVQPEIARLIGCSDRTLRTYYRHELDTGTTIANRAVAESLFNNAVKHNNVAAQIWWTKARMGWRSATNVTIEGTQTVQLQHLMAARTFSGALHGAPETLPPPPIEGEPVEPPNLTEPATE